MEWVIIPEFPNYGVYSDGRVENIETGRVIQTRLNQWGAAYVGMTRAEGVTGRQFNRSLALLVATAYLGKDGTLPSFDTPINLDGDRSNCSVDNLAWRPRWFARLYHRQFRERYPSPIDQPMEDISTGFVADNSLAMAVEFGLLERDVVQSVFRNTYAWPTYQTFRVVE